MSIKEKRELLVVELFTSKIKVEDILFNISIAIDFSFITAEDVCKAVIEAGNTVPGIDKVPITIL